MKDLTSRATTLPNESSSNVLSLIDLQDTLKVYEEALGEAERSRYETHLELLAAQRNG